MTPRSESGSALGSALSVHDVAARLGVHERTVYRLAQAGELPGFRVAGIWRFLPEDLAQWVDAQKRIATRSSSGLDGRSTESAASSAPRRVRGGRAS